MKHAACSMKEVSHLIGLWTQSLRYLENAGSGPKPLLRLLDCIKVYKSILEEIRTEQECFKNIEEVIEQIRKLSEIRDRIDRLTGKLCPMNWLYCFAQPHHIIHQIRNEAFELSLTVKVLKEQSELNQDAQSKLETLHANLAAVDEFQVHAVIENTWNKLGKLTLVGRKHIFVEAAKKAEYASSQGSFNEVEQMVKQDVDEAMIAGNEVNSNAFRRLMKVLAEPESPENLSKEEMPIILAVIGRFETRILQEIWREPAAFARPHPERSPSSMATIDEGSQPSRAAVSVGRASSTGSFNFFGWLGPNNAPPDSEDILPAVEPDNRVQIIDFASIRQAIESDDLNMVCQLTNGSLIETFADPRTGETLLHISADLGRTRVVEHLIKQGINLDVSTRDGRTALHRAIQRGHANIVKLLLESGACALQDNSNRSVLHMAIEVGDCQIVKDLLDRGADPNVTDQNGWTPLHHAVYMKRIDFVKILVRNKSTKVGQRTESGCTPRDLLVEDYGERRRDMYKLLTKNMSILERIRN